ncbi:MAG: GFA family protein [Nevskiaceae bacterium]
MTEFFDGGCDCRAVRYRMNGRPMIVHGCHCSWCQRETGSAFAINAVIETARLVVEGEVEVVDTPSASGQGQKVARCPKCKVALWSNYASAGPSMRFVRVGTLDDPGQFPPDIHIFTSTKQPWLPLPAGVPAFREFYNPKELWPAPALARWKAAKAGSTPGPA